MQSEQITSLCEISEDNEEDFKTTTSESQDFDEERTSRLNMEKWHSRRNLVGFWILGLCNNFAYVVMLSAAHDILKEEQTTDPGPDINVTTTTISPSPNKTQYLQCNTIGTGAILLADIVPALIIKLSAPLFVEYLRYSVKVIFVAGFAGASFLIVAFSHNVGMSLLGVACASISSGMGEITFLAYSSFFSRNVVSTWSSGTGGAGIFGALVYAGITAVGITPRTTVLMQIVVPFIMLISFFVILHKPAEELPDNSDRTLLLHKEEPKLHSKMKRTLKQKLHLVLPLFKYIVPLLTVYFAEYFINQGLMELLYFNHIWLNAAAQYRWYQVDYQLGVFISRSSVNLIQFNKLWVLSILQFITMTFLLTQVFYHFIPSIWIIFLVILFEGLLGGAAYVNTFYRMSNEVAAENLEFSLGVVSISDTLGISLAGLVAIPVHDYICSLQIKM